MLQLLCFILPFAMSSPTKSELLSDRISSEGVQVIPVNRTPESNTIELKIQMPKPNQVFHRARVWVQCRLDGFSLGSGSSQFERASEIANSNRGQTLHVIVDDHPYFAINEPALDPFDESGFYYDMTYKFEIPFRLASGMHTLRCFPARSYGESLKADQAFQALTFYVGEKEFDPHMNLNKPYLTYNEPSDQMSYSAAQPILLDFLISNCELSPDGYKVELTIDGKIQRKLTSWQPYYIYGLKPGSHTIELKLVDAKGKKVSGIFNLAKRAIQVQ